MIRRKYRPGFTMIYVIVTLTVLMMFASLAVDVGRVQWVKGQLRRTADAAARYGSYGLSDGTAVAKAQDAADDQTVNGQTYSLSSSDIQTGNWNSSIGFTSGGSPLNAIKVTCACNSAHSNAVPLLFAQVLGKRSFNISSYAVATYTNNPPGAFVGYSSVSVKNNSFVASYNSSVTTTPNASTYNSNGALGSNGTISGGNNDSVKGNVLLGPSGSQSGYTVSGTTTKQATAISTPTMPAYSAGTNPNSVPANYSMGSDATLAAGTYWFTNLDTNGHTLSFSGAATLYINGNVTGGGSIIAYGSKPPNLTIYQYGNNTFDDGNNGFTVYADVWAPTCTFSVKNNGSFYGRCFFNVIDCKNNCDFFYDESFGSALGGKTVSLVQ